MLSKQVLVVICVLFASLGSVMLITLHSFLDGSSLHSWSLRQFVYVKVNDTISSSEFLRFCDGRDFALEAQEEEAYQPHLTTERGWREMGRNMPPMPYLEELLLMLPKRAPKILEIGCGSGHCMLDLQRMIPQAEIYGINKNGYFYSQSWTRDDLLRTAVYYDIPLVCNGSSLVLPKILPTEGLQEERLTFEDDYFDFIYSQYALDWEKLRHWHSPLVIPRVSKVLKVGGTALLLITFDSNSYLLKEFTPGRNSEEANAFHMLDAHSVIYGDLTYSFIIYTVKRSIGVGIRKCSTPVDSWDSWGCFHDHEFMGKDTIRMKALEASLKQVPLILAKDKSHRPQLEEYHGLYLYNFFDYLNKVKQNPALVANDDLDKLL